ncbi:MAG: glycosyltransferase family 2 protein [Lachnospiraceae bacterium]|nr:glycosyltransferase family 2 protein [Lachnospiraceae bacterium]
MDKLYIVIPAYNESENIGQVVKEWYPIVEKYNGDGESRLVIIDDGSSDNTYEIICELAKKRSLLYPVTKPNAGHGATVLYGYRYAMENGADYIFQTDSDGQTRPEEFHQFWENRKKYSAVIGYRNHREDGISRIIVTKTLKLVLRLIFGLNVTDANTPFRLMRREILEEYLQDIPKDFNLSNVMLTVLLLYNKEKVAFIPITFRPRQGGVNSINLPKITKIGIRAVKDFRIIKKGLKRHERNSF